jgi:glyoxylase-like metal-dependent hydrolase (beta-lactamase superfamily II)
MDLENAGTTAGLAYAVSTAKRAGLTRDLPHGPEDLQWVANSATLVYGNNDAVLVDTFTTVAQNGDLVDWVGSFGRNLTHVYITHGHGDHFFGIKQILDAFPDAKPVATKGSLGKAHEMVTPAWLDGFWEQLFPGQIPSPVLVPDLIDGTSIDLEGHRLEVIEAGLTDTADTTSMWVPDLRLIVAGDVAYNDTHPFLAESTPESREHWAQATERLAELHPMAVVAGHKKPELPDLPEILAETAAYLRDFDRISAQTTTAVDLYDAMLQLYPRRANPGSLWGGAKAAKGAP